MCPLGDGVGDFLSDPSQSQGFPAGESHGLPSQDQAAMLLRRTVIAPLLLLTVLAAACSSGSKSTVQPTRTPPPAATRAAAAPTAGRVTVPVIAPQSGLTTVQIAQKLAPSIVRVQTEGASLDIFGNSTPEGGVGTGVIYRHRRPHRDEQPRRDGGQPGGGPHHRHTVGPAHGDARRSSVATSRQTSPS